MDTITQTPFQPLVQPNQLVNTAPPPVVPEIGADINPRIFSEPGVPALDRIGQINRGVDKQIEQQGSFWPNALAIGALLTGNFGPMIQLEEQKRKTAIGQLATPYMLEATDLSNQGKHEEAQNVINTAVGKFGQRAPEVMQLFKPVIEKVSKDQTNWRDMQGLAKWTKLAIPDTAHPDAVNFRDFAQEAVKNRTLISSSLLENLFTKAIPHIQVLNGQVQSVGQLSGRLTQQPLANVQTVKEVGGPIGEFLSSRLGISIPEITDVLNLKQGMEPVQTSAGPVAFGSREHQYIVQAHQDSMALRASQSFQEKTPLEPSIATALRRDGGATQLQIATGTYTPQQIDAAVTADQARKVGIASAAEIAKIRQNPLLAEQSGLVNLNADTGVPLRRGLSIDEIEKQKLNVVRLPVATFERYRGSVEALTALDNLEPFIANLGNPQTFKQRAASGFNRWASDRLGIALTQNIEVSKAFEVMLNGAIEEATQRAGINQNDKDIRLIKTFVTGAGASPEAGRRAVKEIQKRLADRIYQEVGEASLARPAASTAPPPIAAPPTATPATPTAAPSAQQIPGVPTPNVRQVPAAGVEPGAAYRGPGTAGFAPSGTTTYTPPQRGKPGGPPPRNAAQRQAVEILKSTIPDEAVPAAPSGEQQYKYVKPGTLR
jgi:hypothetical protein